MSDRETYEDGGPTGGDRRWISERLGPTETECDLCGEVILESEARYLLEMSATIHNAIGLEPAVQVCPIQFDYDGLACQACIDKKKIQVENYERGFWSVHPLDAPGVFRKKQEKS